MGLLESCFVVRRGAAARRLGERGAGRNRRGSLGGRDPRRRRRFRRRCRSGRRRCGQSQWHVQQRRPADRRAAPWSASVDGRLVKLEIKTAGPAIQTSTAVCRPTASRSRGSSSSTVCRAVELERAGEARIARRRAAPRRREARGLVGGRARDRGQSFPLELRSRITPTRRRRARGRPAARRGRRSRSRSTAAT